MFHRFSHFPLHRYSSSRPFVLGTYGRGQPLVCHWGPFKGLDKMENGVSRMSWSSVNPCYITESRCWAQKEVMLQRIFSVTGTSWGLSPTPTMPLASSSLCHRHGLCGPLSPDETSTHFKLYIYDDIHILAMNGSPPAEMRIVKNFPRTAWNKAWKNLHARPVSDEIKSI